jgi:hypothetical protein
VLTQKALAAALGVTDRAIREWVADGCPKVGSGRRAVYDEREVRAWLVRTNRDKALGRVNRAGQPPAPTAPATPAVTDPVRQLAREVEGVEIGPPPSSADERKLAIEARSRSWLATVLAARKVQQRLERNEMDPTPANLDVLAKAARTLSEAVRGDADDEGAPSTLREILVGALAGWLARWGEDGLAPLLQEARDLAAPSG